MDWIDLLKTAVPVTGGLTHTTLESRTVEGHYALKVLNPFVMTKPGAIERMLASEKIARDFKNQGIPAVCALEIEGEILHQLEDGRFVLAYPWIPGTPQYYPDFGLREVQIIAALLAKMHKFGDISHRDFDPKNVLWVEGQPFIIDWEAAGPIDPMEELVALAFEWSGFERGSVDETLFYAFFEAYRKAGGNIIPSKLEQGLQGFIRNYEEWESFNLERQIKAEAQEELTFTAKELEKIQAKIKFLKGQSLSKSRKLICLKK